MNSNVLWQHLGDPEYLHVLLNPLPVYGLAMGLLGLVIALVSRSRSDWLAVSGEWGGAISLAADGSLWLWRAEEIYGQQSFLPLLRPTRRPQLIGNIFSKGE